MKENYGVFRIVNGILELESKGHNTAKAAKEYISSQKTGMWTYQLLFFPTGKKEEK